MSLLERKKRHLKHDDEWQLTRGFRARETMGSKRDLGELASAPADGGR